MRLFLLASCLASLLLIGCAEERERSTIQPGFPDAVACLPSGGKVAASRSALLAASDSAREERYIVHFEEEADEQLVREAGGRPQKRLHRRAISAGLKDAALQRLRTNPKVRRIEKDAVRVPLAQSVPWGVSAIEAPRLWITQPGPGAKTCIIDSGLHIGHEDLQLPNVEGHPADWGDDSCGHGTHVAGTLAALNNDVGVVGVHPDGLDLVVVKVFSGESCRWTRASELVDALQTCRDAGAKVVNLSLGGGEPTELEREAFEQAWRDGLLIVAAAGNDGSSEMLYPASYPTVISVAAVDSENATPSFSQRNAQVDLAAPGVDIRSTVPFKPVHEVRAGDDVFPGNSMNGSQRTEGTTGILRDGGSCVEVGDDWKDAVVLCRRGGTTFQEKATQVARGGGVAALIYNRTDGGFTGTLSRDGAEIPVLSLSGKAGEELKERMGKPVTVVSDRVRPASGYSSWSGTSMAAPHVAGIAALLWGKVPKATNVEIREALERSALDIGPPGRDDLSGHGVVRGREALHVLQEEVIGNVAPYAGFMASCHGLTCTFSSTSIDPDGEIASTVFRFDDVVATGTTVTHTFPSPGIWPVEIEVTDAGGATDLLRDQVSVCVQQ